MDLWTEFEGVTIDSAFALNKLLQSEGRSAFFSTSNEKGESVLIRIIECHFDEDEILARWRGIQTLGHPNFLRIDRFGQFLIEEDDITAVYAVLERVDANLGQVLERGRLSAADATQIGLSVASALETLHAHGFVHEHIEPRNIYAVGESVKLRSDCIRETPEDEAGVAARRRDVHDFALALMQVLLGRPRSSYTPEAASLPAPFDEIVRKGMSGEWGLAEIKTALSDRKAPQRAKPAARAVSTAPAATPGYIAPASSPSEGTARPDSWQERQRTAGSESTTRTADPRQDAPPFGLPSWTTRFQHLNRRWIPAGALLLAVVIFGLIFMHRYAGNRADAAAHAASGAHDAPPALHNAPAVPRTRSSQSAPVPRAASDAKKQWRVVAFTYNRQDQAQKRASSLAQNHAELQPQVFSPTGRAPWLVTIGGVLQRDAAYALAHRASRLGLPRDTYAQNYTLR